MIDVHIPANWFYPELPGGPNQYFRYGPYLKERGIQLHIHTVRKEHHVESEFEIRGIKVRRYEVPEELPLRDELDRLAGQAAEAAGGTTRGACIQPLGVMLDSKRGVSRLWKARCRGVAPVYHCMMMPVREPLPFPRSLKSALRGRAVFSPFKKVMMCSRVMGRAYTEIVGVSPSRIVPVPNGIDLSVFSPVSPERKREIRGELDLPQDDPVILYVGSVLARKGIEILVEAWRLVHQRHPRARLVVVGSTGARPTIRESGALSELDRYLTRVFDQIEALPDPGSVICTGEVDNVEEYYRAADLFAFASRREGLPSVILESMACGTPCVTAPFIGLPEDGEEYGVAGEHYIKSSHDPPKLAADIAGMIEDDGRRLEMSARGVEWIRETQEMGKAADRVAEVYHEIAD